MNEKFKKVLANIFWEFGYTQYFLTISNYMKEFILINRTVALFHKKKYIFVFTDKINMYHVGVVN